MSIFKRIFGKDDHSLENLREPGRVSCMDIVEFIKSSVYSFEHNKGMVVVILEGCKVQIFLFDGVARTSWGYNNHQFSTDRVGQTFLIGPPSVFAVTLNTEHLLAKAIQREFQRFDMSIGHLWKLDKTAWDYEAMEALHRDDVGIRISFENL